MDVPVGWGSCDADLNARLEGARFAQVVAQQVCANADPAVTFVVSGGLTPPVTVMIGLAPGMTLTAEDFQALGEKDFEGLRAGTEQLNRRMLEGKATLDGPMTLRKDTLDGHSALVSTMTIVPDKLGKLASAKLERWEIFDEGRLVIIAFSHPISMEQAAKPAIERIKSTLRFDVNL